MTNNCFRYVAWLVYPEVVSSDFEAGETRDKGIDIGGYKKITQTLLDKSSIKRKEQDGKERDTKKRKRETEQEVLECISELPIPKEMALKVMERYLKEKEVSQHHVQFVVLLSSSSFPFHSSLLFYFSLLHFS